MYITNRLIKFFSNGEYEQSEENVIKISENKNTSLLNLQKSDLTIPILRKGIYKVTFYDFIHLF